MSRLLYTFNHLIFTVFSLFTLVKFENNICGGLNGENGTCISPAECGQRNGISSGICANGYGVCCIGQYSLWFSIGYSY